MVFLAGSILDVKTSELWLRSKNQKVVQEKVEREYNSSKNVVQESILPAQYLASQKIKSFKGAFGEDLKALHIKMNNRKLAYLPTEVKVQLILECGLKDWAGKSDISCIFFDVSKDMKEFFKVNRFKNFKILQDGRIFYTNNKTFPKEILDQINVLRGKQVGSPLKIWGAFPVAERCLTTEEAYQQILPVYTSLKELQENDVSGKKVTALHPVDVISSRGLSRRGILDELLKVGYGEKLCNQGKKIPFINCRM
ncbi:MAG: hypothetical protein BGO07_03650 [Alphaproteobacteria bacterium 40-19]|nr:MAG: hypothetical protein BGO07_03650 [Alphaproteobacteria bacterium 40-19]